MLVRTLLVATLTVTAAAASDAPYAGQEARAISSFSEGDIAALLAGEGWGLAKPAELNGWPGPRHVLDMAAELDLTPQQVSEVGAIFDAMNAEARTAGEVLLDRESALDAAFETRQIDVGRLTALLAEAEAARASLRRIHLSAHLATAPLLTAHQRMLYDRMRGYDGTAEHRVHQGQH